MDLLKISQGIKT